MSYTAYGSLPTSLFKDKVLDANILTLPGTGLTLFGIYIDNTDNSHDVYVKIWFDSGAITLGTTAPDIIIKVKAGTVGFRSFMGQALAAGGPGISAGGSNYTYLACVQEAGTPGTTSPENDVTATIATD